MNFYEKPLSELTSEEWEKICMKCGKCCLCKYSEGDVIHFSNYICRYFDLTKRICSCYENRLEIAQGECKKISLELLEHDLYLLPPSCAYRRLYEGRGLPPYHPLLTGDEKSVEKAGQTVKSLPVFSETSIEVAVEKMLNRAGAKQWEESKIMRELKKVQKKFQLQWLETYPASHQNEEPAP